MCPNELANTLAFARSYASTRGGMGQAESIGRGLLAAWLAAPLNLTPSRGFMARPLPEALGGYSFGGGVYYNRSLASQLAVAHPDLLPELKAFDRAFDGQVTHEEIAAGWEADPWRGAADQNVLWAGGWGGHVVLDYGALLSLGTVGLRAKVSAAAAGVHSCAEDGSPVPAFDDMAADLRSGMLVMCDCIDAVAVRYRSAAAEAGLGAVADALCSAPHAPCRSWEEALQAFWLVFAMDGFDSPGRFDQYMWPYYSAAIADGKHAEAFSRLEDLWLAFEDVRAWNLCVGGTDESGTDASNQLSLDILALAAKHRQVAPNLTMRAHATTPDAMWQAAASAIASGSGMPALYNDGVVVEALTRHGIPLSDARLYCMNGCNQFDIGGKSHMGLEDGELSLIKCLELALNDGFDPYTQRQLGPRTGQARDFRNMDDLIEALYSQISFFVDRIVVASNRSQAAYSRTAPDPLRSVLVEGCIEKGRAHKSGGPLYNHGQVLLQGIGNTADSLAAIESLVFSDQPKLTMNGLMAALRGNWADNALARKWARAAPKFGNDNPAVDRFAAKVVEFALAELKKHATFRGGVFGGGSSVYVRGAAFGAHVGATPDGRLAGRPLADSVGAVQGEDRLGPTAALASAARPDLRQAVSGYVLNLKLTRNLLDAAGLDRFIGLVKGYFAMGGQQLQVTVADAEELAAAQRDPEEHRNLVVRVGGFSDYFVNLGRDLQDEIISRTAHRV